MEVFLANVALTLRCTIGDVISAKINWLVWAFTFALVPATQFNIMQFGHGWRGCLIGNTALEIGAHDREIVDRLKIGLQILRTQFKRALSLPSAGGAKRAKSEIERLALHLVAGIQALLVLAKAGSTDADIKIARAALLATVSYLIGGMHLTLCCRSKRLTDFRQNEEGMKVIPNTIHGILDHVTVALFALAPILFGFMGTAALIAYALAVIHLIMTLLTNMPLGMIKIIPMKFHALVELLVGPSS